MVGFNIHIDTLLRESTKSTRRNQVARQLKNELREAMKTVDAKKKLQNKDNSQLSEAQQKINQVANNKFVSQLLQDHIRPAIIKDGAEESGTEQVLYLLIDILEYKPMLSDTTFTGLSFPTPKTTPIDADTGKPWDNVRSLFKARTAAPTVKTTSIVTDEPTTLRGYDALIHIIASGNSRFFSEELQKRSLYILEKLMNDHANRHVDFQLSQLNDEDRISSAINQYRPTLLPNRTQENNF